MADRSQSPTPADLRTRLETARLDLLALFRTLDRMHLAASEIPQKLLQQLFKLDADCAEALWSLDQPTANLDRRAMLRDTLATLNQLPPNGSPVSQETTASFPLNLSRTGTARPQGPRPQRGLQHGARPRSRKRVSTHFHSTPASEIDNLLSVSFIPRGTNDCCVFS